MKVYPVMCSNITDMIDKGMVQLLCFWKLFIVFFFSFLFKTTFVRLDSVSFFW
jgi:hypothetical protein